MQKKANCENCISNKDSIFSSLTPKEKELLKKSKLCTGYGKGEIIYKEGDKPAGLICLCEGKVKIFKEGVGGRDQIIRMHKPISFIGFRALFANDKYIASAEAIEDCSLCIIDKPTIEKLIRSNSEFSLKIIEELAMELGFSSERTVSLTQKHIRGRLAESLLFLAETYGFEDDNKTIKVYLSREDIANLSNMTTSNAIRTLSTFVAENVLYLNGRKITVTNYEELKKISAMG
jgi:CRP-like cAMP-binding protein